MKEVLQSLARLTNGYSSEKITIGHSDALTFLAGLCEVCNQKNMQIHIKYNSDLYQRLL